MSVVSSTGRSAWLLALVGTLIGTAYTFILLKPGVGFDDANITMNYAENIAAGHGYVYFIGGERVEGSTSPLWTVINVAGFLLPAVQTEIMLAILGFAITALTVWLSLRLGALVFRAAGLPPDGAYLPVFVGFIALPAYFGWSVWSLMDAGLWVLLTTWAFVLTAQLLTGTEGSLTRTGLLLCGVLIAITRPEGIAVVFGFATLLAVYAILSARPDLRTIAIRFFIVGGLAFAALAAARYAYFGDIFPNTFYSKVSTNRTATLLQGLVYAKDFLGSPLNVGILGLALAVPVAIRRHGHLPADALALWAMIVAGVLGGISIYVLLGGDHFGSFRFFIFAYPALLPLAALALLALWSRLPAKARRRVAFLPTAAALVLVMSTWGRFGLEKGHYEHEFRIAEQGREIGRRLSFYPGSPSLGIIAAGGIAMTYDGVIYDLLGLNWVEMARADRAKVGQVVNHGGFSKAIFYKTLPDIVQPRLTDCDRQSYDHHQFFTKVMERLFEDTRFRELYQFECWDGLVFYRRRDFPPVSSTS